MPVKHIYFVRHGETADNRSLVHQSINVSLDARGQKQASAVAKRLSSIKIDALIASDATRTQETANAVSKSTGVAVQTSKLLRELHRGVLMEGSKHFGWKSIKGAGLLFLKSGNKTWHFGNGENVSEFRRRLRKALSMLEEVDGENIVVVTHRGVINGLCFEIKHNFKSLPYTFLYFAGFGHMLNGSITEFTYDKSRGVVWRVERANDVSHLRGI